MSMNPYILQLLTRLKERFKGEKFSYGEIYVKGEKQHHIVCYNENLLNSDEIKDFIHVEKSKLINDGCYDDVLFLSKKDYYSCRYKTFLVAVDLLE